MLESWILAKLEPYHASRTIILRDPQRMVQPGARAVDGWAQEHGFTVLFCTGNLALREMVEPLRGDPDARVLLVDRSRGDGLLFYPDLEPTAPQHPVEISLRDYLVEKTGDPAWPGLVNDRNLSRLILGNLDGTMAAHGNLRGISPTRFSDSDLYKIILGAVLSINPFAKLSPSQVRRLCLEQHAALDELNRVLPPEISETLRKMVESAPRPFCWLLDRDPELIIRAFALSALLHQHGLDHALLLPNFDPALHEYKVIEAATLDASLQDQLESDPDRTLADVQKVEDFLREDPQRLRLLLHDQLNIGDGQAAQEVLKQERLSGLLRSMALASLLVDLVLNQDWRKHRKVLAQIEKQEQGAKFPVMRRPTEQWQQLLAAYRRGIALYELTEKLREQYLDLKVAQTENLEFARFDQLWNHERLNRLDYFVSDLERMLRVGDILPVSHAALWPEFEQTWNAARQKFKETSEVIDQVFRVINRQFQDLYLKNYTKWIQQPDSPVVFTHQFLPRLLQAHWDPKSGQKAVVLVFDGLRTDAWDELVRPVLEERYELLESRPGSALIPTETELSRKAIAAGCLPADFPIKSKRELDLLSAWLKSHMGIAPQFEVVRDVDTVASGMTVQYRSKQLDYIVFNFTDDNLHHNPQELALIYKTTVNEIIRQDVRSVLRELPSDALVFVTSDHGFTPMASDPIDVGEAVVGDANLVKYPCVRAAHNFSGADAKKVVSFDIRALKIPIPDVAHGMDAVTCVLFARPGYVFRRQACRTSPDRYGHGGLSLAECMVPMVVMGPKKQEQGVLSLEEVHQTGTMIEGEPLEMEIRVKSSQWIVNGFPITISFSQNHIPTRKEFYNGVEKTYRVGWKPVMPEITEEHRSRGTVEFPVTVMLSYRLKEQSYRVSKTVDMRVRLDSTRLRRRIDSKLDLMMGKLPKETK
ncbi:MAG: PglZ domain-containing protein [Anaerolineaceae bacterium]|nr:PglZ domain-containing protein [Anaerolineaceae bacterium]